MVRVEHRRGSTLWGNQREHVIMTEEGFRVGQLVRLKEAHGAPDLYQVVHVLKQPLSGDVQYRLRGIHEPHERHVRDHQIRPATLARAARREPQFHSDYPEVVPPSACVSAPTLQPSPVTTGDGIAG
jgi:hypothetical protein